MKVGNMVEWLEQALAPPPKPEKQRAAECGARMLARYSTRFPTAADLVLIGRQLGHAQVTVAYSWSGDGLEVEARCERGHRFSRYVDSMHLASLDLSDEASEAVRMLLCGECAESG